MDAAGIDVHILPTLCRVRRNWSRSFRLSRLDKLMKLDECQIANALSESDQKFVSLELSRACPIALED